MRFSFLINSITEFKYLEALLKKKASEGLLLRGLGNFVFTYDKTTPKDLDFKVLLREPTSTSQLLLLEREDSLIEKYKDEGWTFHGLTSSYLIFSKASDADFMSFDPSPHEVYSSIFKKFALTSIITCILMISLFIQLYSRSDFFKDIWSNGTFFKFTFFALLPILTLYLLFKSIWWSVVNKGRLKRGQDLKLNSIVFVWINKIALYVSAVLFGIPAVLYLTEISNSSNYVTLNYIMFLLTALLILLLLKFSLGKHKLISRAKFIIGMFIIFISMGLSFYFIGVNDYPNGVTVSHSYMEDKIHLTHADISNEAVMVSNNIFENWSPLVSEHYTYTELFMLNGSKSSIRSTKTTYRFSWLAQKAFYYNKLYGFSEPFDLDASDDITARKIIYNSNHIIILDGKTIYEIKGGSLINEEDFEKALSGLYD